MTLQYRNLSDEELLLRVQNNSDKDAQLFLYKRYKHIVLGVLMLYIKDEEQAIEGTEKVFLDLWFEAQKKPILYFQDWIHNTIKKYVIRYNKQKGIEGKDNIVIENSEWKNALNLPNYNKKNIHAFQQCMNSIPIHQREWIENFYEAGKSIEELSKLKEITELEVLKQIQGARRALKICMHQKLS